MKIIVPTDFSVTSYNAFHIAKNFAEASGGEIILLHVIETPSASFSSTGENLEDNMTGLFVAKLVEKVDTELQALKSAHKGTDLKIVRKIGDPLKEIRDLAMWEKADLIIMGERGQTEAEDLFIGSLTDKVVRSSKCPVITVNQLIEAQPIKNIVYATDLKEEHPKLIHLLKQIQRLFGATLRIVKVNTKENYANDIDTMVDLRYLVDKYEIEDYSLEVYNHEDEEYGIIYYADEVDAELIAMGVHQKTGIRRLIHGGDLAEEVAEHTNRPVLTFHFDGK